MFELNVTSAFYCTQSSVDCRYNTFTAGELYDVYTLHIANIDTVFCMAASHGTASGGGVTNVDINKC